MNENLLLTDSLISKKEVASLIGGGASLKLVDDLVRRRMLPPQIRLGYRTVRFNRRKVIQAIRELEAGTGL